MFSVAGISKAGIFGFVLLFGLLPLGAFLDRVVFSTNRSFASSFFLLAVVVSLAGIVLWQAGIIDPQNILWHISSFFREVGLQRDLQEAERYLSSILSNIL